MRHINEEGLALVKAHEGLELKAYVCPAGVLTIGYGSTTAVTPGMTISQDEAEERLRHDLERAEQCVGHTITGVVLTDNEFSACVSICYNIGCGAFSGSTLAKLLNAGDRDGAAQQFKRWDRGGGKILPGLTARRRDEAELFTS